MLFFRCFGPFFGQNTHQNGHDWWPWLKVYLYVWSIFYWSCFWVNLFQALTWHTQIMAYIKDFNLPRKWTDCIKYRSKYEKQKYPNNMCIRACAVSAVWLCWPANCTYCAYPNTHFTYIQYWEMMRINYSIICFACCIQKSWPECKFYPQFLHSFSC